MQFVELRKYERDSIIQVFGIPPEIVGILQNSNRATIEAADLFFAKYTLTPILKQMREAFQKQLVPLFDETGLVEVDFISPIQEDKEYKLNVMRAAPWAFLKDEIRAEAGEDPLPNGKGAVFMVPMNLQEVALEQVEPSAPTQAPAANPNEQPTPQEQPGSEAAPAVLMSDESQRAKAKQRARQRQGRRAVTGRGYVIRVRR
jgi:hypothetical protein